MGLFKLKKKGKSGEDTSLGGDTSLPPIPNFDNNSNSAILDLPPIPDSGNSPTNTSNSVNMDLPSISDLGNLDSSQVTSNNSDDLNPLPDLDALSSNGNSDGVSSSDLNVNLDNTSNTSSLDLPSVPGDVSSVSGDTLDSDFKLETEIEFPDIASFELPSLDDNSFDLKLDTELNSDKVEIQDSDKDLSFLNSSDSSTSVDETVPDSSLDIQGSGDSSSDNLNLNSLDNSNISSDFLEFEDLPEIPEDLVVNKEHFINTESFKEIILNIDLLKSESSQFVTTGNELSNLQIDIQSMVNSLRKSLVQTNHKVYKVEELLFNR